MSIWTIYVNLNNDYKMIDLQNKLNVKKGDYILKSEYLFISYPVKYITTVKTKITKPLIHVVQYYL